MTKKHLAWTVYALEACSLSGTVQIKPSSEETGNAESAQVAYATQQDDLCDQFPVLM